MNVRFAKDNDITDILILGEKFFDLAKWPRYAEWDKNSVFTTLTSLINGKLNGILLVGEVDNKVVGMSAALIFPFYFNFNILVGQEIFWYVEDEFRNSGIGAGMMQKLEQESKLRGASVFIISSVSGLRDKALARLYSGLGYGLGENTFIKRL